MSYHHVAGAARRLVPTVLAGMMLAIAPGYAAADWAPSKPVEIVVPAGPGGGADKMARLIQEIVAKHKLMPQPVTVINMPGNSGAEGFLAVKQHRGNEHQLVVTLSNLFTTPLATGADFNWRDMTPISMMALDEFVLWVNADSPYRSAEQYLSAVRAAPKKFKMGGTGSKQEDEIITRALEREAKVKFTYVPLKGGGDVAKALAAKEVDSTVNNPIEAVKLWQQGKVRPLGIFDSQRIGQKEPVAGNMGWRDIPTMKEEGYSVEYLMLRGIFAPADISDEARKYYTAMLAQVVETEEWQDYINTGALKSRTMSGELFKSWLMFAEAAHRTLMSSR